MNHFIMAFRLICALGLVVCFMCLSFIPAQAAPVTKDVAGSQDSPLLKRYEGSYIIGYEKKEYSDFMLPLSVPRAWNQAPEKKLALEGKHTRIIYVAPEGRSTLEVFRNYQQALKEKNFNVLFSCRKNECGKKDGLVMIRQWLYPQDNKLKNMGQVTEMAFSSPVDMRYLAAKVTGAVNAYVSIFVAKETFNHFDQTFSRAVVLLDIIEMKAMESKMIVVPARKMAREINEKGSFSLYGIYFDTDSSVVKAESAPTLNEIEKLLRENKNMKLFIVGHTDNQGAFDYNMTLSQKRGQAVMEALVKHHGINPERLKAYGVGMLSPKAANDTEQGRKKNRRVELVKQ